MSRFNIGLEMAFVDSKTRIISKAFPDQIRDTTVKFKN